MKVAEHTVVSIEYTLTDDLGEVLDESEDGDPLVYLHGAGNIIPGLESALDGRTLGEAFNISVAPEDGYGDYDDTLVAEVERDRFPQPGEIEVGDEFEANTPDGPRLVRVVEVNDDTVTIDANHPLAGEELHFKVKIVGVRAATKEEMDHGHAHGPGGHHHH
jgi:FKBP-type peptidyl-prolyl cis-trans isomerase SlyD